MFPICFDSSQLKCTQLLAIIAIRQCRLFLCTVSEKNLTSLRFRVDSFVVVKLLDHHHRHPWASTLQNAAHSKIPNKPQILNNSWINQNPHGLCQSAVMDFYKANIRSEHSCALEYRKTFSMQRSRSTQKIVAMIQYPSCYLSLRSV